MYALQVLSSATSLAEHAHYTEGQKVRINQGPLKGVQGVVAADNGRPRLIVTITLLQRSVVAEVERQVA